MDVVITVTMLPPCGQNMGCVTQMAVTPGAARSSPGRKPIAGQSTNVYEMSRMMHIFVAGATGTLGLPLVRELVARGHTVTGLTRSPHKRALLEALGAQAVVADALDAPGLERAVRAAAPT